jgi:hypothetical protein
VLEGDPKQIEAFMGAAELDVIGTEDQGGLMGKSLSLVEAIVPEESRVVGRTMLGLRLIQRHGVTLLGISRQGRRFRERVAPADQGRRRAAADRARQEHRRRQPSGSGFCRWKTAGLR